MNKLPVNTIYIISKGRPHCRTAQTLERMSYPGQWFIVCGNNDETLPEYTERWKERVIVFDWYSEVKRTDTMDNLGFDGYPSGACPARNATRRISEQRGELRHWQFDDDYTGFTIWNPEEGKNVKITDGDVLCEAMYKIAEFGYHTQMRNVGFIQNTTEAHPEKRYTVSSRVFNAHNLPSTEDLFVPFVGRMNDDLVNAVNVWRYGGIEMSVKYLHVEAEKTQSEHGGMTNLYQADGTARKTAYAVLAAPSAAKLVFRFNRYHHAVSWKKLRPMIISQKWRRFSEPPPKSRKQKPSAKNVSIAQKWRERLL